MGKQENQSPASGGVGKKQISKSGEVNDSERIILFCFPPATESPGFTYELICYSGLFI